MVASAVRHRSRLPKDAHSAPCISRAAPTLISVVIKFDNKMVRLRAACCNGDTNMSYGNVLQLEANFEASNVIISISPMSACTGR